MVSWSHLPTEILQIVFKHLEEKYEIPSVPGRYINIATKDLIQCQLTCKNWTGLAQPNLYKNLKLDNLLQLRALVDTLITQNQLGFLLENISIIFGKEESYDMDIFSLFSKVLCFCPDLKGFYTNFAICKGLWTCLQTQRSRGYFSKLELMTRPQHLYYLMAPYNIAAYSLRETLREFTIYFSDWNLIQNGEIKLEKFVKINTLYFILFDRCNIYTIHRPIQKVSSVKWIDISYKTIVKGEEDIIHMTDESSPIHDICPNVKKLCIRNMVFDKQLCEYLMKVFPNLDTVELNFKLIRNPGSPLLDKLSTSTALRFLHYLLKMKRVNVSYIPIEDLDDVMINLQGIHSMIQHVNITYKYDRRINGPTYLKVSTTKRNLNVQVIHNNKIQIIFPQIGLMETYSINLKSIRLDMGMQPEMMKAGVYISNTEANLCHIFQRFPNLKILHIFNTPLDTFGTRLELQKRHALCDLTLEKSLIGPELLRSLSFYIYHIDTLTIRDSMFMKEEFTYRNKYIDMPSTKFNRIDFYETRRRDIFQVGLKLMKKTNNDSISWFVGTNGKFETCIEEEYEELQRTHSSVSFFIRCADIRTINLCFNKNQITFES